MSELSISQQAQAQATAGSELLKPLFICKIVRNGINPDELLSEYKLALKGMPRFAIERTIEKIRAGMLCQSNVYCPLPPELAQLVRDEWTFQRRLEEPRLLPAPAQPSALARMQNRWADFIPLATGITLAEFQLGAKHGRWPVGAVFAAILGNVYAGPADKPNDRTKVASRAFAAYREQRAAEQRSYYQQADAVTEENRDYWRKISEFSDAKFVTPEQAQFRGQVEQQLGDA